MTPFDDEFEEEDALFEALKGYEAKRKADFAKQCQKNRDYIRRLNDDPAIRKVKERRLFDSVR